jgi:glutamine amidotransferase
VVASSVEDLPVPGITIVDYGMGNLGSVRRKLEQLDVLAEVTADPDAVKRAEKLVLPGVGHFGEAMSNLKRLGLYEALVEAVLERRVPVLGICLGMQLMARRSEEGSSEGLGWIDAEVVRFAVPDRSRYKVPHIGWGRISVRKQSRLLRGIADDAEFYFVHSYNVRTCAPEIVLADSEYGHDFVSAVERDNLFGVQFHPEKSHHAGALVLRNFVEL